MHSLGTDTTFVSDVGLLLQVLLPPSGAQPAGVRANLLSTAASASTSRLYTRLVLRQIIEEAGGLSDDELTGAIGSLTMNDLTDQQDLPRLRAAIGGRDPLLIKYVDSLVDIGTLKGPERERPLSEP
jgi:hypothetical protein